MEKKKISLDDIFNDELFIALNTAEKTSNIKTADDRLIDSFEELNVFVDKNGREPNTSSMSEYVLLARLKNIRENEQQKISLKPFDRHNLLGEVEIPEISIDDILNDDEFGLIENDLSIFKFKNIPKEDERAEADFIASRKPLKETEFKQYEKMFQKVHRELKEGKRRLLPFADAEKNLIEGNFYLVDGLLAYLKSSNAEKILKKNKSGDRMRIEGRTFTIFENGTYSNMLFRSLGKAILKNGKMVTNTYEDISNELFVNAGMVKEEDFQTGWVYILKSKSNRPEISSVKDLYKIGFSSTPIDERIKNAKNEATYLFAEVTKIESFAIFNRNADTLEKLLHRFFASACLNIDLYDKLGNRFVPREWFVVPIEVIREAIELILNEGITKYKFNFEKKVIEGK